MEIKIKLSGTFDKYKTASTNELIMLHYEKLTSVKNILKKLMIPDDLPKLILINGREKNEEQILQDGDTLYIFPRMSGG